MHFRFRLLCSVVLVVVVGCGGDSGDVVDAGASDARDVDAPGIDAPPPDAAPSSTVTWSATEGTPDTDCAPWTLVNTADVETPSVAAGELTLGTSANAENMFYSHLDTDLLAPPPATVIIEARARLVSGASSTGHRGPASVGFRLGSDLKKNSLYLVDGEIFLLSDENVKGPSAQLATTDAFHTYRLEVDTTTGAITVFRDGTSVLTGMTFPEPAVGSTPGILFGDPTVFAHGTSAWTSVSHNAHTAIVCP